MNTRRNCNYQPLGASAWAPLRRPLLRGLWMASLTSSIGTWMHEVGAAWLMTSLTLSPVMVALMQTATSLPIVLLALPAGAIADTSDRREILLFTQGWMLVSAAVLGVLTVLGATTPWLLLILTFALGVGAAMNAPAWQATTREAVLRPARCRGGVQLQVRSRHDETPYDSKRMSNCETFLVSLTKGDDPALEKGKHDGMDPA